MKIHRANLSGRTVCGVDGKISVSGVFVNCPVCRQVSQPVDRDEIVKQLRKAAGK